MGGGTLTNAGTIALPGSIDPSAVRHYSVLDIEAGVSGEHIELNGGGTIILGNQNPSPCTTPG